MPIANEDVKLLSVDEFIQLADEDRRTLRGYISYHPSDRSVILFGTHPFYCPVRPIPREQIEWIRRGQRHVCGSPPGRMWYATLLLKEAQTPDGKVFQDLLDEFILAAELRQDMSSCTCIDSRAVAQVSCDDARQWVREHYQDYEWGSCDDFRDPASADSYATAFLVPKLVREHGSQGSISPGHRTINHGSPALNTFMPYAGWNES